MAIFPITVNSTRGSNCVFQFPTPHRFFPTFGNPGKDPSVPKLSQARFARKVCHGSPLKHLKYNFRHDTHLTKTYMVFFTCKIKIAVIEDIGRRRNFKPRWAQHFGQLERLPMT
jgi:hypothetical protein